MKYARSAKKFSLLGAPREGGGGKIWLVNSIHLAADTLKAQIQSNYLTSTMFYVLHSLVSDFKSVIALSSRGGYASPFTGLGEALPLFFPSPPIYALCVGVIFIQTIYYFSCKRRHFIGVFNFKLLYTARSNYVISWCFIGIYYFT